MRTRGAVLLEVPGRYEVVELDVDEPRPGEIRVRWWQRAVPLRRPHRHGRHAGRHPALRGGHEGAGIVEAVGPDTPGLAEGDHVVFSFLPGCGRCRWCATGMQNLCDLGATLVTGCPLGRPGASGWPRRRPVGQMCGLSTFCEYTTVSAHSAVKIDPTSRSRRRAWSAAGSAPAGARRSTPRRSGPARR